MHIRIAAIKEVGYLVPLLEFSFGFLKHIVPVDYYVGFLENCNRSVQ